MNKQHFEICSGLGGTRGLESLPGFQCLLVYFSGRPKSHMKLYWRRQSSVGSQEWKQNSFEMRTRDSTADAACRNFDSIANKLPSLMDHLYLNISWGSVLCLLYLHLQLKTVPAPWYMLIKCMRTLATCQGADFLPLLQFQGLTNGKMTSLTLRA